jgi:LacI family transcriptional regulator
MSKTPTVYEVARAAQTSTVTVSRVLAGNDRVDLAAKERVLKAVDELGYVASAAAKGLASNRTHMLGLCFPDASVAGEEEDANYWYDEVIRGMERAARRAGYMLLIAAGHDIGDKELLATAAGRCDGLLVMSTMADDPTMRRISSRTALTVLGSTNLSGDRVDHLTATNEAAAQELTAHLCDVHGCRNPAFLAGRNASDSVDRFRGFQLALADHGLPMPAEPAAESDFTSGGGYRAAQEILASAAPPDALVCVNDQTAVGALRAVEEAAAAGSPRIPVDRIRRDPTEPDRRRFSLDDCGAAHAPHRPDGRRPVAAQDL